jgi:MFS family permease
MQIASTRLPVRHADDRLPVRQEQWRLNITYEIWGTSEDRAEAGWRRVARVAMTPPLRDYITARVLEMTSKWMFRVTTPLVVWQLSHDERMLAASLACLLLPGLVMELIGGIFADRYDRQRIMAYSCWGSLACNVVIAVFALMGWLTLAWLLGLTVVYGAINAVSHAASKTIVTAYVPKDQLSTAVSLNTVVFNVAGFVGPALAATIMHALGTPAAYLACALLTLAFVVLLGRIPAPPHERGSHHQSFLTALRDGFVHIISVRLLLYVFLLHVGSIALARPFVEFVPAIVHHAFGGGVKEAGMMLSAFGLGSICGGLWLAGCEASRTKLTGLALGAMPVFAAALIGILLSPSLPVAMLFCFVAGIGMITRGGAIQSLIQLEAKPAYRGRVVALHGVTFEVGCITGAVFIGQFAKLATIGWALGVCVALLMVLWLLIRAPLKAAAEEA